LGFSTPEGWGFEDQPQGEKMTTKTKEATKAWLKVQEYREMMNKGCGCMIATDFSCVVFLYQHKGGKPCAIGYKGRSKKPAFHFSYKSSESRELSVDEWMDSVIADKEKAKAKAQPRALNVGDVLYSSWGWEQTNIDFYRVVKLVGKQSVELIEIGALIERDGDMTGKKAPDLSVEIGEKFLRRVSRHNGSSVSINSCASAWKAEFKEVAGVRVYRTYGFSSYA
jgi:hypothetical protein